MTELNTNDKQAIERIQKLANPAGLDIAGGKLRRSSSRFCLGVEHGDYNGTELFGVGTDRFIWIAYKPNGTNRCRLLSGNFAGEGIVEFDYDNIPEPQSSGLANSWGRFPCGVAYILQREGFGLKQGFDAVIWGNIPGGGMSRSASLSLNLILTMLEVNGHNLTNEQDVKKQFKIVELAQAVENVYIGSPCGLLDQIMIFFARAGMGTHYNPSDNTIKYVPLGKSEQAKQLRIVVMDTGTVRPGLEKSTYKIRRSECEEFVKILQQAGYEINALAEIKDESMFEKIKGEFADSQPNLMARLDYIYHAQKRFYEMMDAWKKGDIKAVGEVFRRDGLGLRDDYCISGPELETMCDIARTVPGVWGERMLGGGDKGAAGALVQADSVESLQQAVKQAYPLSRPAFGDKYAVHVCKVVKGIENLECKI